ncbi:hypothetical protein CC1G_04136 [Coprinopsis cinerea okayama7|uniref:Uncharacterized protein n=1 Tax=Coprinopsis cinerea (strain Okayama-7 / 130 / ATCC MYA-4618 / FGSC 9003) TaxID=240176 RepID=A8NW43_COPC7|nr:hypothetical protein CC1G_04136 [Coprinopsis cinerea okayama7\|eukprot:XP_001836823.2 hypothetical protein CC1G_04136 [Coprinopsis cinerea okayama7\
MAPVPSAVPASKGLADKEHARGWENAEESSINKRSGLTTNLDRKRRWGRTEDAPMELKKFKHEGGDDGEEGEEDEGVVRQPAWEGDADVTSQPAAEDDDGASQFEGDGAIVPDHHEGSNHPDSGDGTSDVGHNESSTENGDVSGGPQQIDTTDSNVTSSLSRPEKHPQVRISVNFTRLLQQKIQKQVRALKWIQQEQAMMRGTLVALRDDMKAELDHLRTLPK